MGRAYVLAGKTTKPGWLARLSFVELVHSVFFRSDESGLKNLRIPPPLHHHGKILQLVLQHGEGGEKTEIVCGYLHSEHPLFNPALGALPPARSSHSALIAAAIFCSSATIAATASSMPARRSFGSTPDVR